MREVIETVTLLNVGDSPITEVALELEEFRNQLSVSDEQGKMLPFLTKEAIRDKLPEDMKAQLDRNEIFLVWVILFNSMPIQPQQYKVLRLRHLDYEDPKMNIRDKKVNMFSVYRVPFFSFVSSFFANETVSLSFVFEEGVTHHGGLVLLAKDQNGDDIEEEDIENNFHYTVNQHNITLSISGKKRKEKSIQSIDTLYAVVPDEESRSLVGGITFFSIVFPAFIVITYFHFKSLSLFGIMSTTELLSIVSLGLARFPSGLISIKKRLIISTIEIFFVYVIILFPGIWFTSLYNVFSHFI